MKTVAERTANDSTIRVDYDADEGVVGKYAVHLITQTTPTQKITSVRTFDSETAWSDAERYANNLLHKIGLDYTNHISL